MADRPQLLLEPHRVVVGPWPPGCPRCLRTRRAASATAERTAEMAAGVRDRDLPTFLADTVAELATAGPEAQRFWIVDTATLTLSRHGFLTDPRCPECSDMPADTERGAKAVRRAWPKLSPESSRVRLLDQGELARTYVDGQSGLIPSVTSYTQHSFPF